MNDHPERQGAAADHLPPASLLTYNCDFPIPVGKPEGIPIRGTVSMVISTKVGHVRQAQEVGLRSGESKLKSREERSVEPCTHLDLRVSPTSGQPHSTAHLQNNLGLSVLGILKK